MRATNPLYYYYYCVFSCLSIVSCFDRGKIAVTKLSYWPFTYVYPGLNPTFRLCFQSLTGSLGFPRLFLDWIVLVDLQLVFFVKCFDFIKSINLVYQDFFFNNNYNKIVKCSK